MYKVRNLQQSLRAGEEGVLDKSAHVNGLFLFDWKRKIVSLLSTVYIYIRNNKDRHFLDNFKYL